MDFYNPLYDYYKEGNINNLETVLNKQNQQYGA